MLQAWLLQDIVVEKEVFEAKAKARQAIIDQFGGSDVRAMLVDPGETSGDTPDNVVRLDATGATRVGYFPSITYDEKGRPRPAVMAYDSDYSDDPAQAVAAGDNLRTGTVDTDDEADVITFPGLDPPLG